MAIFSNLPETAVNKSIISDKNTDGKWTAVKYKTSLCEGVMLTTAQSVYPEPVELKIELEGMHRIYIGVLNINPANYFNIKLSGEPAYSGIKPTWYGSPTRWVQFEYAEEIYWKSADLTNQSIIIDKPRAAQSNAPVILWIRCEKMSDEEVTAYNAPKPKCLQAHIDIDPFYELEFETVEDTLVKLYPLKNSNTEFCSIETWVWNDALRDGSIPTNALTGKTFQGEKFDREELFSTWQKFAHENDFKLYAATRMSCGDFERLVSASYYNKNFVAEHPELYIKNRDGSSPRICSYAFDEVREYMLCELADTSRGFDGVTLIYTRGLHIGFEKPVLDRFAQIYPSVDPRRLPAADERLHGVWCEFMTEFMRKLRERLGRDKKINVLTDYGLETAKNFGLDVEAWAREGLIDSATQCNMEMFEELDDCIEDGLINLEKYKEKARREYVTCRRFATDPDKVCAHMPEYRALEEKYGIKVYHTLPWENTTTLSDYAKTIEKMQNAGAEGFFAWDVNHLEYTLPEFHTITGIGNRATENITLSRFYKMISINGNDMTYSLSAWKG